MLPFHRAKKRAPKEGNPKSTFMMINCKFFLFLFVTASIASSAQTKSNTSTNWIENLREFRNALYQNNRSSTKAFFEFPITDGNEIWYFAYSDSDAVPEKMGDKKPFTETDFDKCFGKLFTKQFIDCFLKINTKNLSDEGASESSEIKTDSSTYKLYVTFDKKERIVELNFATTYKVDDENEIGETNYIYFFKILNNGRMKFLKFFIAG